MATKNSVSQPYRLSHQIFVWSGLANGDDGNGADYGFGAGGRTVQVGGTFGVGGNLAVEGSNDGTTWYTLNDLAGSALGTITAAGLHSIREEPLYIRPHVTAGDGTTSLTVTLVVRKNGMA